MAFDVDTARRYIPATSRSQTAPRPHSELHMLLVSTTHLEGAHQYDPGAREGAVCASSWRVGARYSQTARAIHVRPIPDSEHRTAAPSILNSWAFLSFVINDVMIPLDQPHTHPGLRSERTHRENHGEVGQIVRRRRSRCLSVRTSDYGGLDVLRRGRDERRRLRPRLGR